jgi:hypothetical protein
MVTRLAPVIGTLVLNVTALRGLVVVLVEDMVVLELSREEDTPPTAKRVG